MNAENKVFGNLGILKGIKKKNPDLVIGICGCMMQQEGMADKILKKYPFVDIIFGTHNSYKFPEYLNKVKTEGIQIKEIFDISGGDVANGVLPYLDYKIIAQSPKMFWGYSDLTTIINAIYAKTGKESVLYQVRNLIYDHKEEQLRNFQNTFINKANDLFQIKYHFIQQKEMRGIVVGGNIRCFLKLAGTEYMPDLTDKILLLESYSGTVAKMETYLCQLQQLGAFEKVAGILLGTFTEMESAKCIPSIETLVKEIAGKDVPIAVTKDIGHGTDSKAIIIGKELHLSET